ncbi:MAG: nitroreductase [Erysipelotrichaceae bacterium]|nr:nitroreductase [Erysipelotrichaceae bacterium]MBR2600435.1 nitroreductase [Erysipelotrichaceae bacterium]
MNETINSILTRRSIRKFTDQMISKEDLDIILECGKYAASGQGKQSGMMIAVQDPEMIERLERLNAEVVDRDPDKVHNFYGAKTVIVVLARKDVSTHVYDGALVMGNLMLAAHALGIGSCWIHRAKQTFETEEGKAILKELGVEDEYEGIGNCILGYPDGEEPVARERKENWVYRI